MAIIRDYRCPECSARLGRDFVFEHFHMSRDEPAPPCPNAPEHDSDAVLPSPIVSAPNIKTNASRAGDITYKILEEDYGMSDMKDNLREGDVAAKVPVSKPMQDAAKGFWAANQGKAPPGMPASIKGRSAVLQVAKPAAQIARAEGKDPMKMLHSAFKKVHSRGVPIQVIAKG